MLYYFSQFIHVLLSLFILINCDEYRSNPASFVPIYLHIDEYILSNKTQWSPTPNQHNDDLISCTIDTPSLCLIQTSSTLILSHHNHVYDWNNASEWSYSNQLSIIPQHTETNTRRRLKCRRACKRRRRRRKRRKQRRKKRRRRRRKRRCKRKRRRGYVWRNGRCRKRRRRRRRRHRHHGRRGRRGRRGQRGKRGQIGVRGARGKRGSRGWPGRRGRSNIKLFKGLFRGIRAGVRGQRCHRSGCHRSRCMNTKCGAMGQGMGHMGMGMHGMGHMGMGTHGMGHMGMGMHGMGTMNPMMNPMMGMGMMNPMMMGMNPMMMAMSQMMGGMNGMNGDGTQPPPKIEIHEKKGKKEETHRRLMHDMKRISVERCVYQLDIDDGDASICVASDDDDGAVVLRYMNEVEGKKVFEFGHFVTNEWIMNELVVFDEQIYECHDHLVTDLEPYHEICVEKWTIHDNAPDIRIIIKSNEESYHDMEFRLMEDKDWAHVFVVRDHDGKRILCRYLHYTEQRKSKLCVHIGMDTSYNRIKQIHKISISHQILS
eukprot:606561_1